MTQLTETVLELRERELPHESRPHGKIRRFLRWGIHFLSYRFILSRARTQVTCVMQLQLTVPPTVFHPGFFVTSKMFAQFIARLDLRGKTVADVGTGSGILALAAAAAGASNVLAIDINPNAIIATAGNAKANGFADQVRVFCGNLLSAVASRPLFDIIISSPPSFAGAPADLADRAWHAGPGYRDISPLFEQANQRLRPGGRLYLLLSSDSDLALFARLIEQAGFRFRIAREKSILIEKLQIYELEPMPVPVDVDKSPASGARDK